MKCLKRYMGKSTLAVFFFNGKLCLGLFKNIEVKIVTATENQSIFIHLLTISFNIKSFILFK